MFLLTVPAVRRTVGNAMADDTLVFDIETSNFFTSPEVGWNNFEALNISVVGVYSYNQDKHFCFEAHEREELEKLFAGAGKLVGFSSNKYDIPVLQLYFKKSGLKPELDLWKKERVDLLEEIEMATGRRISLGKLSAANGGDAKEHRGSEAIRLFEEGHIDELKEYCSKDVRLTKELYDKFRFDKKLNVPDRYTGELREIKFVADAIQASLF
jgi:predicted PolB exonuclease-like 3'-5' exonuclease